MAKLLPNEQKYFDRESSKKMADRFHELFKLRESAKAD